MEQKKFINITIFVIIIVIIIGVAGYFYMNSSLSPSETPTEPTQPDTIIYNNNQYGFNFTLPSSWKGYSIVSTNWEGNMVDTLNQNVRGPEISIRHPLWSVLNPRQDIPIMVFTLDQWNLIQAEKLSVSAAPIPPSEFGRNANYVFALPARYNFAFPTGYEEVDKIIQGKPLQAF
jgi:heme/copper-type cytochrome/quinol oxidase subunit 2